MSSVNIKKLKKGMNIRICKNPRLSIIAYGGLEGNKRKLANTIQEIQKFKPDRIYIVPPRGFGYSTISFVPDDIRLVSPINIKPEIFDPKYLVIN